VDRDQALMQLATAHAVALRLRELGASDETIATALAIPVQSVPNLIAIAESKLAALLDAAEPAVIDVSEPQSALVDADAPVGRLKPRSVDMRTPR
jgi:hypothetical protein